MTDWNKYIALLEKKKALAEEESFKIFDEESKYTKLIDMIKDSTLIATGKNNIKTSQNVKDNIR